MNQGLFGCFVSTVREKGVKRALSMLSHDKPLTADYQATLDQSVSPWWNPDPLWARAKQSIAEVFVDHHPGAALTLLGQSA